MEQRIRTPGHERAVERIVRQVDRGETVFRALPTGYRAFESMRLIMNRNTIPRRDERLEIYRDAQQRLGETAMFAVLLMWASREFVHDETPPLVPIESRLVGGAQPIPRVDYEFGKAVFESHIDIAIVTHINTVPTGARLQSNDTNLYRAFSLVFGEDPISAGMGLLVIETDYPEFE